MISKLDVRIDFSLNNQVLSQRNQLLLRESITRLIGHFIEKAIYTDVEKTGNFTINSVTAVSVNSYTFQEMDAVDWFEDK